MQGSETLKALARALPPVDGQDPTFRLKSIGRPTAFIIEAPLSDVDEQDQQDLQMRLDLLAEQGIYHACDDGDMTGFTTSFPSGIPPQWLEGHEFIDVATDSDDRSKDYRYGAGPS